MMSSNLRFSRL